MVWGGLLLVGMLALAALGFQFGISGGKRYQISIALACSLSAVLILKLDFDNPLQGVIHVDHQPLKELLLKLGN